MISLFSFHDVHHSLLTSTERSMGITGLAVLLTAFIYAGQHKLDLFHALCVFHLVGLVGISISPHQQKFESQEPISRRINAALYYFGITGFFIFLIYVFATAPHFGSVPECNADVKYVIMGIDAPATNPVFRGLFIASFGLSIIAIIFFLGTNLDKKLSEQFTWLRHSIPGKQGARVASDTAGRAYIIAMTELMIQRNTIGESKSNWGFGQVLAMVMLIGPCVDLVSHYMGDKIDNSSNDNGT
jgi:hypothetical protein